MLEWEQGTRKVQRGMQTLYIERGCFAGIYKREHERVGPQMSAKNAAEHNL